MLSSRAPLLARPRDPAHAAAVAVRDAAEPRIPSPPRSSGCSCSASTSSPLQVAGIAAVCARERARGGDAAPPAALDQARSRCQSRRSARACARACRSCRSGRRRARAGRRRTAGRRRGRRASSSSCPRSATSRADPRLGRRVRDDDPLELPDAPGVDERHVVDDDARGVARRARRGTARATGARRRDARCRSAVPRWPGPRTRSRPSAGRSSGPSSWSTRVAERGPDRVERGLPRLDDLAGQRVRVDDDGAELGEAAGDGGLARRDAAGERDQGHEHEPRQAPARGRSTVMR